MPRGDRVVESIRGGHDDGFDRVVVEHLGPIGVGRPYAVAAGDGLGHVVARIADCDQLDAVGLLQRRQVRDLGDPAAADQGQSDGFGQLAFLDGSAADRSWPESWPPWRAPANPRRHRCEAGRWTVRRVRRAAAGRTRRGSPGLGAGVVRPPARWRPGRPSGHRGPWHRASPAVPGPAGPGPAPANRPASSSPHRRSQPPGVPAPAVRPPDARPPAGAPRVVPPAGASARAAPPPPRPPAALPRAVPPARPRRARPPVSPPERVRPPDARFPGARPRASPARSRSTSNRCASARSAASHASVSRCRSASRPPGDLCPNDRSGRRRVRRTRVQRLPAERLRTPAHHPASEVAHERRRQRAIHSRPDQLPGKVLERPLAGPGSVAVTLGTQRLGQSQQSDGVGGRMPLTQPGGQDPTQQSPPPRRCAPSEVSARAWTAATNSRTDPPPASRAPSRPPRQRPLSASSTRSAASRSSARSARAEASWRRAGSP